MIRHVLLSLAACAALCGQAPDPLDRAYKALAAKSYDEAIGAFLAAIEQAPGQPSVRKDLAYTYLKIGETDAARDQFAEAMRLEPADEHVALEYAFLCFETRKQAEARRVFDRLRTTASGAARAAAEQAFENIDQPLGEGVPGLLRLSAVQERA